MIVPMFWLGVLYVVSIIISYKLVKVFCDNHSVEEHVVMGVLCCIPFANILIALGINLLENK